ncbi:MAG: DNA polymerase IV [Gammaproteobacteria bacterium]|nr:DNA polymerase IV [Gammaproteobacteria bacterium]MDE2250057.1 DNA polymerase IV [Gammaproteobacteria bacterium]
MNEPAGARERRIAHLDMDAFYASVELLRHPRLEGLPVVIGGRRRAGSSARAGSEAAGSEFARLASYQGRGVVTTATYAAREFGVHSGMGLMQAARLCPAAILLPADFDEYRRYSRLFKAALAQLAPRIEDRGIDEVYIDFDAVAGGAEQGGRILAQRIQQAIRVATGLSCSIGVAPNKLLAKLASEFDKPNGITIIHATDLAARVWPLPCRKLNGVGPKASARLEQLGVRTIGELARCEPRWLIEQFGRHHGQWLHEISWGRDERDLSMHSEPVSMSCETTFERDLHAVRDRPELSAVFTSLCARLAADLARHGYAGRTIGVKLRYDNFQSVTRAQTLEFHTADATVIRRTAGQCLKRAPLERRLRLLGVRVGNLVNAAAAQPTHTPQSLDLF